MAPCTFSGAIEWSTGGAFGAGSFLAAAFGALALGAAALGAAGSSVLVVDFLGLVEESIKERSILFTFGASTSAATAFAFAGRIPKRQGC